MLTFAARGRRVVDLTFVQNVVYAMRLATNVEGLRSGSIYNISNHQPQQLSVMLDALLHQQLGLSYRIAAVPLVAAFSDRAWPGTVWEVR